MSDEPRTIEGCAVCGGGPFRNDETCDDCGATMQACAMIDELRAQLAEAQKECQSHEAHRDDLDDALRVANRKLAEARERVRGLEQALNGDGACGIAVGNLRALVYHLEQGADNGGRPRSALANFLRSVAKRLDAAIAAPDEGNNMLTVSGGQTTGERNGHD